MTPSHFVIFLKGNLQEISSGLEAILGYFGFTKLGVLEFSRINFIELGDFLDLFESSFIVYWLGSNLPCMLTLFLDLAQGRCACFYFIYFLMNSVPFIFSGTLFRFFFLFFCLFRSLAR